jgi:hypothetical protein
MKRNARRVSGSWSAEQITVAAAVVRGLLAGADVRVLVRQPSFARFAKHVLRMEARTATMPPASHFRGESKRDAALAALRTRGPLRARDLANILGVSPGYARWIMQEQRKVGTVMFLGRGSMRWALRVQARTA